MKKFNKNFKIGTKVKVVGVEAFVKIESFHETRKWIKLEGYAGSWQLGNILKYTNK